MLKKISFACFVFALSLSCSQPEPEPIPSPGPAEPIVKTVSFKASLESGGKSMSWVEGDAVTLYVNGKSGKFTASAVEGSNCTLTGDKLGDGEAIAIYPYNLVSSLSNGALTVNLPSVQTSTPEGFDKSAIMAAGKAGKLGDAMVLKNQNAFLRFSIGAGTAGELFSVSVKSVSNAPLSGKVELSFAGSDPVLKVVEGNNEILLQGKFEAGEYFVPVIPGAQEDLLLTFKTASGNVEAICPVKANIEKGAVIDLGSLPPVSEENDPVFEQLVIDLPFTDGKSFQNPFASPDLTNLSGTVNTPSYPHERLEMTLPADKGGYTFAAFGTLGIVKNSVGGLCIASSMGDYFEFPAIPGMCLNTVVLTSGNAFSGVSVTGTDGTVVSGGNIVEASSARGTVIKWTLYGSVSGKSYKLVNCSSGTFAIQRIILKYGPESRKPLFDSISPLDYGLKEAKTGEDAFMAIYWAHTAAVEMGVKLDYTGVGNVEMTVPASAKSIPLPPETDFKGTVFKVLNTQLRFPLFTLGNSFSAVEVSGEAIDKADYSSIPALATGEHILNIVDNEPWVDVREGYSYGAVRRDVVLVKDGKGSNGPSSSYSTASSKPQCSICYADDSRKSIKNVTLDRDSRSTELTNFFLITGQNNLFLSNIKVKTPARTGIYGDEAIEIDHCTNVLCEDVTFDGLYNDVDESGYGFSCNNLWNATFRRITSHTLWAGFDCNNMQDSYLEDSDVERFDTHCYGKNITIKNSTLTGKGIPASSVFGRIYCEKVKFVDCFIYSMRTDYNAYVPFDIVLKDCEFSPKDQTALFHMGLIDRNANPRPELSKKNWPNVQIDKMTIHLPSKASTFSLLYVDSVESKSDPVGYITNVKLKDVTYDYGGKTSLITTYLSNKPVSVANNVNIDLVNVNMSPEGSSASAKFVTNLSGNVTWNVIGSNVNVSEK